MARVDVTGDSAHQDKGARTLPAGFEMRYLWFRPEIKCQTCWSSDLLFLTQAKVVLGPLSDVAVLILSHCAYGAIVAKITCLTR